MRGGCQQGEWQRAARQQARRGDGGGLIGAESAADGKRGVVMVHRPRVAYSTMVDGDGRTYTEGVVVCGRVRRPRLRAWAVKSFVVGVRVDSYVVPRVIVWCLLWTRTLLAGGRGRQLGHLMAWWLLTPVR